VVVHLVTLYDHAFIPLTVSNFFWPGQQPYRPLAVNLGVLGLYTMVILVISSWIRRRLSYRVWRWLHYLGFATFVLVTWHGLLAGSDAGEPWMHALYAGASAAVGYMLLMRLLTRRTPRQHQQSPVAPLAPRQTPARLTQLHQLLRCCLHVKLRRGFQLRTKQSRCWRKETAGDHYRLRPNRHAG
jgi:predicted ferric reductase